jgi:hypothetical protein
VPYTYTDVADSTLKLVKGGAVVGTSQASATKWPSTDIEVQYGGASSLWGTTLTVAEVNASDFGVVLSVLNNGGTARVDRIGIRVHTTLPSNVDNPAFLAVMEVDDDRSTVTPRIYALPRAGLTVGNDPNVPKASSGATLQTSRIYIPDRFTDKTWNAVEFYAEIGPTSCAGLQVWASIEDGTAFQLLTGAAGAGATFTTTGQHRAYFPVGTEGAWCYLQFIVPTPGVGQTNTEVSLYEWRIIAGLKPRMRRRILVSLQLGDGEFADVASMRRSVAAQRTDLESIHGQIVPYRTPMEEEGYAMVKSVTYEEVLSSLTRKWTTVAQVELMEALYT